MQDLILLEPHEADLRALLHRETGAEAAAYVIFGQSAIAADPWTGAPRTRFVSHAVRPVPDEDQVSASPLHVTWSTRGLIRELGRATRDQLAFGIVHTHPGGRAEFSRQDDRNEADLARAVCNRNGPGYPFISLLLAADGGMAARVWRANVMVPVQRLAIIGRRLRYFGSLGQAGGDPEILERQARLFGSGVNDILRAMRVAIVGCGGTGSPLAMLLLRLGIGRLLLIDKDVVEVTNLNRIHGARRSDIGRPKVEVLAREIREADLGVEAVTLNAWAGTPEAYDALKACDVIFGCTDDHDGRALLNRFAYFYGVPYIDVGLRVTPAEGALPYAITARLSAIAPGSTCLLCRGTVDPRRASEEHLERTDPDGFRRLKAEAYVEGGGDPAPAVVTFTTEAATMAANELIQALTGYRGAEGMAWARFRRFETLEDKRVGIAARSGCQICDERALWGRGDVEPFLYRAG
ncbi:MAG: ThiF family adenylyltransferase [Rhodospirillales bacterium]|nr:ThiF family adenylyltransferase [Rhodospirillales bacterium]